MPTHRDPRANDELFFRLLGLVPEMAQDIPSVGPPNPELESLNELIFGPMGLIGSPGPMDIGQMGTPNFSGDTLSPAFSPGDVAQPNFSLPVRPIKPPIGDLIRPPRVEPPPEDEIDPGLDVGRGGQTPELDELLGGGPGRGAGSGGGGNTGGGRQPGAPGDDPGGDFGRDPGTQPPRPEVTGLDDLFADWNTGTLNLEDVVRLYDNWFRDNPPPGGQAPEGAINWLVRQMGIIEDPQALRSQARRRVAGMGLGNFASNFAQGRFDRNRPGNLFDQWAMLQPLAVPTSDPSFEEFQQFLGSGDDAILQRLSGAPDIRGQLQGRMGEILAALAMPMPGSPDEIATQEGLSQFVTQTKYQDPQTQLQAAYTTALAGINPLFQGPIIAAIQRLHELFGTGGQTPFLQELANRGFFGQSSGNAPSIGGR